MRRRDMLDDPPETVVQPKTGRFRERSEGAEQLSAAGDDIVRRARIDLRNREDGRIGDRDSAGDVRLERHHDFAGNGDRIQAFVRHRRMAASARDRGADRIRRSKQRPRPSGNRAARHVWPDVECEGGVGTTAGKHIVDKVVLDHEPCAMIALLPRLKHEDNGAGEAFAQSAKRAGGANQHRAVRVMAASVHRARVAGGEGKPGLLLHRQRVHVAAEQHRPPIVAAAAEDCDEAAGRRPLAIFERQPGERRFDLGRGARAIEADLRVGMNRAAKLDDAVQQVLARFSPVRSDLLHQPSPGPAA